MKTFGMCACIGGLAFVLAGYQAGLFRNLPAVGSGAAASPSEDKKEQQKQKKTHFPKDLAPAARAEPVPLAAAFDMSAKKHRMVILKTTGALFEDWQDRLKEDWRAESVEDTALVLVVSPQKKIFVDTILYPNNAPPISRYKFLLEASVVEAKTGKVLANRQFINMPRNIQRIETWDTTALGSPVEFRTVFNWAASNALSSFPDVSNTSPIVNVVN